MASRQCVRDIADFQIHQTAHLPSDHAPVTLENGLPCVNLSLLEKRAGMLTDHHLPMERGGLGEGVRQAVGIRVINPDLFTVGIPSSEILYDMNNVFSFNMNITDAL